MLSTLFIGSDNNGKQLVHITQKKKQASGCTLPRLLSMTVVIGAVVNVDVDIGRLSHDDAQD